MQFADEVAQSVNYLQSSAAEKALAADAYWPKWNSPWWHMLLLHEMGHTNLIPESTIEQYVDSLNRIRLKIFPIHPHEWPEGADPFRGIPCHCQLGNVYQVLAARGVDVDQVLPWIRPWFLRYQMADGGLNCDDTAYLAKNECPSSMVGTIAAFEAVVLYTPKTWTDAEQQFVDKGAKFLLQRELRLGSQTQHNAAEQKSAEQWTLLCFPRFYLYDVLRGLNAILAWQEKTRSPLPHQAIKHVTDFLTDSSGDQPVKIGRIAIEGANSLVQAESGDWVRQKATTFPLLDAVSTVGSESLFLTKQWRDVQAKILSAKGAN
jgi:hypothetical protein